MAELVHPDGEVNPARFDGASQTRVRKVVREIGVPSVVASRSSSSFG